MSGSLSQFGVVDEVAWGTAVAVTKFYEIIKEDVSGDYARITSQGLGAGLVDRADRFDVFPKGAAGTVEFEPLTKQWGFWLKHMFGSVAAPVNVETDVYKHTATLANLAGKAFTAQFGRTDTAGVCRPFTYSGGKVTSVEFGVALDQVLVCRVGMDFKDEKTSGTGPLALQTATYPTGAEIFTFAGATMTVGGAGREAMDVTVRVENALKTDIFYLGGGAKKEPPQDGKRQITFSAKVPFAGLTEYNKVAAATRAGALESIEVLFESPSLIGATEKAHIKLTMPLIRLDEAPINIAGPGMIEVPVSGVALMDGSTQALTVDYQTSDATV